MALSSKNFVNVNISHYTSASVSGSRNIGVLIDCNSNITDFENGTDTYFTSISDFTSQGGSTSSVLYTYVSAFFNNGGQQIHYVKISATGNNESDAAAIVEAIAELPTDEIVIASTCSNIVMQIVATKMNNNSLFSGISEKKLVTYLHSLTVSAKACKAVRPAVQPSSQEDINAGAFYTATAQTKTISVGYLKDNTNVYELATEYSEGKTYYIMKYVGNDAYENPLNSVANLSNIIVKYGPQGIEMTVLAYLSQINVYRGTIADYCYTPETVSMFKPTLSDGITENTGVLTSPIVDDNSLFEELKKVNINCDINLSSYGIMEYGGNMTNGTDLVNDFIRIVLTQTVTDRILGVLRNKLRYNQVGLSLVSAAMSDELQRYKSFGYLSTEKIWSTEDLYDSTGRYLIVSKNTPVTQGYLFKILPFTSLSTEDLQNHMLPSIYLVIADSYSIRTIEIVGKVF